MRLGKGRKKERNDVFFFEGCGNIVNKWKIVNTEQQADRQRR